MAEKKQILEDFDRDIAEIRAAFRSGVSEKGTLGVKLDVSVDEVIRREVTSFGTGAHIIVPQNHIGKKVIVIIEK